MPSLPGTPIRPLLSVAAALWLLPAASGAAIAQQPGVSASPQAGNGAPVWPEVAREARPWTRWWWHGSAVDEANLTRELEAMRRAGLGGVEITPIYGVAGEEERFIDYLSPRWLEVFEHTLRESERLDLGVDVATGNGWPFGGPWVTRDEASRFLAHRSYALAGGERLSDPIAMRQEPLLRAVGNQIYETHGEILAVPGQPAQGTREQPLERPGAREIDIADLRDPISSNDNLQALAIDQARFPRDLPLRAVVAYSPGQSPVEVTDRVDAAGRLDWTAPSGDWTVYALFAGWHGKQVERAGPGGEGDVIDHFSEQALEPYLERFDEAFAGHDIASLRGFFNDSYEVDDAAGEANWTPELLEEFRGRRGYDLLDHLPALLEGTPSDTAARVLTDYRQTMADLLLDEFTEEWREWAQGHDAIIRNQAHGSPGNLLDLYAASDIPETEGTEIQRIRFASSAGHLAGHPLIAAEAATWLGEHFTSTLADVRQNVDRYLLGGVNHVVYHGTAYSPDDAAWPGWLFYAAVHFNSRNPWWEDFGALNRYVGRAQAFLQTGAPDEDVLLYFPISDWYAAPAPGDALLQHFNGMPGGEASAEHPFVRAAERLDARGYAYDFVSDALLTRLRVQDGVLRAEEVDYRVIVVPRARYMPIETVERLAEMVEQGATVIALGGLPDDVAGLAQLEARRRRLRDLLDQIQLAAVPGTSAQEARVGQGRLLVGDDLDELLRLAAVRREVMVDDGLRYIRRAHPDGTTYFIANWGDAAVDRWVPLAAGAAAAALYDPMQGRAGFARVRAAPDGASEVYLQMQPGETRVVRTYDAARTGQPWEYLRPAGDAVALEGEWTIRFVEGGPTPPPEVRTRQLGSWTELPGEAVRSFSGSATYTLEFDRPAGPAEAWILDLGAVYQSARVTLNGGDLGTLLGPVYRVAVADSLMRDRNTLTVTVTNLMANRIAELDRRDVFWKKFYNVNFPSRLRENRGANGLFDASAWEPRPSGLAGPVTLTRAARM